MEGRHLAFPLVDGRLEVPLVAGRLAGHQGSLPWLDLACLSRRFTEFFETIKSRPSHGEGGRYAC